jgi:tetratricopeptide (TPR) repeat protein
MSDDLYERYKEALRVGHVAVLRGSLDAAIDAYRAAGEIAPSRALPHSSLGGVLLRLGRLEEALVEYAAAVARAPRDEGALLGQADALSTAGQLAAAAAALDTVADIQAASERLPEAADTLRRAIELEANQERARRQQDLVSQIRMSAGDQAAEKLLARALRLRDEPSARLPAGGATPMASEQPSRPAELTRPSELVLEPPEIEVSHELVALSAGDAATSQEPQTGAEGEVAGRPDAAAASALEDAAAAMYSGPGEGKTAAFAPPTPAAAEPPATGPLATEPAGAVGAADQEMAVVGVMDVAVAGDGELSAEQGASGDELLAAAEAADLTGDEAEMRSMLLATARAYAAEGRYESALDAAHRLLKLNPSDVDAHLLLAEMYMARDWNALAAEKLVLLERLADLDGDEETRRRVCAIASRAYPRDERLGSLCS